MQGMYRAVMPVKGQGKGAGVGMEGAVFRMQLGCNSWERKGGKKEN